MTSMQDLMHMSEGDMETMAAREAGNGWFGIVWNSLEFSITWSPKKWILSWQKDLNQI